MSQRRIRQRQSGLILLVVLGMLSLLSLLAVSYVVFSGQSRNSSIASIKRDYRLTPHEKLMDDGLRQILRGTTDPRSLAWKNDLVGDLYGSDVTNATTITDAHNDLPLFLTARYNDGTSVLRDNPQRVANDPYVSTFPAYQPGSPEGPQTYPIGVTPPQFLKIPLAWQTGSYTVASYPMPEQSDAWNGRVITFTTGPLAGKSLRIVRYVGEVDVIQDPTSGQRLLEPERAPLQYSITVDFSELQEEIVSYRNSSTGVVTSSTIASLLSTSPASLLYENPTTYSSPYVFLLNAGVMNSNGMGMDMTGATTNATTANGTITGVPDALLANRAASLRFNSTYVPTGDTDEPYDAPDPQNFFLALKQQAYNSSVGSDDIIPSFHRPAVINWLMKVAPPDLNSNTTTYWQQATVKQNFLDFLELVERASGRPVSFNIPGLGSKNPDFSGSSAMFASAGSGTRSPQLAFDWNTLPNAGCEAIFQAWLRWLTRGPWDVDNDGDGIMDSVWVDLNYPLMTSPEGKLLKALVAFYIEDMDGKLDINAAGNAEQVSDATSGLAMSTNKYGFRQVNASSLSQWPQGGGFGTAEISLRPLFASATEYSAFLQGTLGRYRSEDSTDTGAGVVGNDPASTVLERNRANAPTNYTFPGLTGYPSSQFPMAVQGKSGFGLDLLGNPILIESGFLNETDDDPYDARVLFRGRSDQLFSFTDYQRLIRFNDVDRIALPKRLQSIGSSFNPTVTGYMDRIRSISPRNVMLSLPTFPLNYNSPRYVSTTPPVAMQQSRRVSSFVQFVEAFAKNKVPDLVSPPPADKYFPHAALTRLFPIEFMQNRPLDLNRPLGNGADTDVDGVTDEADEGLQPSVYPGGGANEEYARDTSAEIVPRAPPAPNPFPAPPNYDPQLEAAPVAVRNRYAGNEAKQLLARHLYCLAQLILPQNHRFSNQPTNAIPTPAERARILAQWAVNVVDFRDPDYSCTRFAYDHNPFQVKLVGTTNVYWVPGFDAANDGVVWGLEQPEMLFSESLAFHNINVRRNPSSPPGNPTYQQLRVPQGSLFMEFIATRSTANTTVGDGTLPPPTAELYTLDGGRLKLDLGKSVANPSDPNPRRRIPVWRVAFTKPVPGGSGYQSRFTEVYKNPQPRQRFRYSYQVGSEPSGLEWDPYNDGAIAAPEIDRVMWFADLDPVPTNAGLPHIAVGAEDRVFRYTAGVNRVAGGQYLVVGPRPMTYLGSKTATATPPTNRPSNHRFELVNGWMHVWNQENVPMLWADGTPVPFQGVVANNALFFDRIQECVTMTAGMAVPTTWTGDVARTIGLNVSEPTRDQYYQVPTDYLNSLDTGTRDPDTDAPGFRDQPKDAYIDLSSSGSPPLPLDNVASAYLRANNFPGTGTPDGHAEIRTAEDWTTAVLQRLADPSRPYHQTFNPYITIDWMPIDLTVFSGEVELPEQGEIKLSSRQKTGSVVLPTQPVTPGSARLPGSTFYSYHTSELTRITKGSSTDQPYFDYELPTELYTAPSATPTPRGPVANFSTFGYLNPTFVIRGTGGAAVAAHDYTFPNYFEGAPGPNPWARGPGQPPLLLPHAPYFPNRDFVNAYELMNVPLSAPGQFLQEFVIDESSPVKFKFTLDFEDLQLPKPTAPSKPGSGDERSTALMLECVGVRSPWIDSWRLTHPNATQRLTTTIDHVYQSRLFENYRPPFNMMPTFREPGRINLNTVTEPTVFRGLMWNMMTPTDVASRTSGTVPYQASLVDSRRGYTTLTAPTPPRSIVDPNPQLDLRAPTEFMRIFGSPLTPYNFPLTDQMGTTSASMTLLRDTAAGTRLFASSEAGVFPATNLGNENSFLNNYPVQRLANLTTNRSNVYSVRMTLGYFEFNPATGALGQEYGVDQGRSVRHRAYYLIDRSVPVGYQPGHDHNTADCIMARAIIE